MATERRLSFWRRVAGSAPEIRGRVEAALQAEGFGILTEIDVQATLRAKLGVEMAAYLILGACNPALAHRALQADPSVGVLLPCNVVLRADGDQVIVEAMDPVGALGLIESPDVQQVAEEARARLERALASVSQA